MTFVPSNTPRALSYSSWSLYKKDPDEFFIKYLARNRAPRLPQENYMAVGSGFDAFVKAALHSDLFGHEGDFAFDKLFDEQVENHKDFAHAAGNHALNAYVHSGAYAELLKLLEQSIVPPRFESKLVAEISGVPFTGKPDLRFMLDFGRGPLRIVLDWKVRGYCSKSAASPSKGYALCRDGQAQEKPSRSQGKEHGKYLAYDHLGLTINQGYMETCSPDYANQVSVYGWMLGEEPGDENVVCAIDEIVAKPNTPQPLLRVANHKARVSRGHQLALLKDIVDCWDAIQTGHIFPELTREQNDEKCEQLELEAVGLASNGTPEEDWFNEVVRPQFKR